MVRAKKYIGQHFLKDDNIAKKILSFFDPGSSSFIIEIGFGTGILSKYLIEKYENILFLDIDNESYGYMIEKYPSYKSKFVLMDFLQMDFSRYNSKVCLIGNLPYNISSQIFFRIFENRHIVEECVFMVQKEVANRLISTGGDKNFGILSVLLGLFFDIKKLFDVNPSSFLPPPKIKSSVIKLKSKGKVFLGVDDETLKLTVKTIFGKRRKMLRNSLKHIGINVETDSTLSPLLNKRPEELSIFDFVTIAKAVKKQK